MPQNLSTSVVDRLIGRIYDMALEPEISEAVATEIGDMMGGSAVAAGSFELVDGIVRSYGPAVRFDPDVLRRFCEECGTPDVNPVMARFDILPRQKAIPLHGLVEPGAFHRSPVHETLFRPQRFSTCLYSVLQRRPQLGCVAVYAFEPRDEFTSDEIAAFERILPHFTRSLQIRQRLLGAEQARLGPIEALSRLPFGVILIGIHRDVLFANEAAEALIRRADGLTQWQQRLRAATGSKSAELDRLIGAATEAAAGRGTSAGDTLVLPRPSGLRPLIADIMPLRYDAPVFGPRSPAAVVFIADPESRQELPEAVLSRLFQLTPQQTALARHLMDGYGLSEAAGRLGVSRNTAHSHLKQIYEKTATHRQSELVRLLLTITTTNHQN